MGEPATPISEERKKTQKLAREIVQSVIDDEELPSFTYDDGDAMPDDAVIFFLAQEILLLMEEK